ncbi:MAG: hypothetical protein ACPLZD_08200 [Candidatus Saccharicenans sp.]
MNQVAIDYLSLTSSPELKKEGLPFWIFYLLLSLILLLIFINFLQNKELRRKLNYLLSGPRRKFIKLRLQIKLKKEEEKKDDLFKQLGQLTAKCWPELPEIEEVASEIRSLEEKSAELQARWHTIYREPRTLKLKDIRAAGSSTSEETVDSSLKENEEALRKTKAKIEEALWKVNQQLGSHYQLIGRLIYKLRPEREDLAFFYFQIDKTESKIKSIKEEIGSL